jgi:glucose-6-phosphate 1-dehydrogenase
MVTTPVDMEFHYRNLKDKTLPEAYERLLLDAMSGDASLFARGDEIELAWSIIGPILEQENQRHTYSQLSEGPREAEKFIQMDGRAWELACVEH